MRSFDPTIHDLNESNPLPKNLRFEKIGISNETGKEYNDDGKRYSYETLADIIKRYLFFFLNTFSIENI